MPTYRLSPTHYPHTIFPYKPTDQSILDLSQLRDLSVPPWDASSLFLMYMGGCILVLTPPLFGDVTFPDPLFVWGEWVAFFVLIP